MKIRAGPFVALIAAFLLFAGCATVSKVGHVLGAVGDTVSAIGDVLVDGAAKDIKNGTDALGVTAPAPSPTDEAAPNPDAYLAPSLRPTGPILRPETSPPTTAAFDLNYEPGTVKQETWPAPVYGFTAYHPRL